jgi:hypothetical protein
MKNGNGNRPAAQLLYHQSSCAVAVDADQAGKFSNDFQRLSECLKLSLEWNTRSCIQSDLADDGGSFRQFAESLCIERFLWLELARMASYAPRDMGFISIDDEGGLVEREGHGEDCTCACQFARGSGWVEVRVSIE